MKIRNGFVSNSSTSSFIVCGWKYPLETPDELIKIISKIDASKIRPDMDEDNMDSLYEILDDISCNHDHFLCKQSDGMVILFAGNIQSTTTEIDIEEETVEEWMGFLKPFPPGVDTEIEQHFPKVFKLHPDW